MLELTRPHFTLSRLFTFLLVLAALPNALFSDNKLFVTALDLEDRPLAGIRFSYQGVEGSPTTESGTTEITLPPDLEDGQQIKLLVLRNAQDWLLVNPMVNVGEVVELRMMPRADFRLLAGSTRAVIQKAKRTGTVELTAKERRRLVAEYAEETWGLSEEQLALAITSFGASARDPMDEGIAAYISGEYLKAEIRLREALTIAKEHHQEAEDDIVETARFLASVLYEEGRYKESIEAWREAIAVRQSDPSLLSGLGIALEANAEWSEAEATHRRALEIYKTTKGINHPFTAEALNDTAQILRATGRLTEAEPLFRQALLILEASHGPNHTDVAIVLNNLAVLLSDTNRLHESETLYRRVLEIFEHHYGANHPHVAIGINNLAELLYSTGRLEESEPLYRRALAIDEHVSGTDHPNVAIGLNNLANVLRDTNRLSEAEPLYRRAIEISEASLSSDHPNVSAFTHNLAKLLLYSDRLSEAETLIRRALEVTEIFLGHDHAIFAFQTLTWGDILHRKNQLEDAERLYREAIDVLERSVGQAARSQLEALLQDTGDASQSTGGV